MIASFRRTLLALVIAAPVWAGPPTEVRVQTTGDNQYTVQLTSLVSASPERVWHVLTDYDHHAGFLPYMTKSRVVRTEDPPAGSKAPGVKWVEQEGHLRIMFWTYTMQVTQRVVEHPIDRMRFDAVAGDFKQLTGAWDLAKDSAGRTQLACQFLVEPKRHVPAWAVNMAARHYLATMVKRLQERAEGKS